MVGCWATWRSVGLHSGVLGYMIECWVTWWRVLHYIEVLVTWWRVLRYIDVLTTWWRVLDYMVGVWLHGGECWFAFLGVGLHDESVGLYGGELGYIVGSVELYGEQCWVTWWKVLDYMMESVWFHCGELWITLWECWVTWWMLGYMWRMGYMVESVRLHSGEC